MKLETWLGAVFLAALTVASGAASAGQNTAGAVPAGARPVAAAISGPVKASAVYKNAGFASGGVALRNRGSGIISIGGVTGPVKAGWLYWAVITASKPTAVNTSVSLGKFFPSPAAAVTVKGTIVGSGQSPGWGPSGSVITVFRGPVPLALLAKNDGDGLYELTLAKGASGLTNGSDPFVASNDTLPLMEGASLVVVGTGSSTVAIYDKPLAGQTFGASFGLTYTLRLPVSAAGSPVVLFDEIGADGQMYLGDSPNTGFSQKTTSLNGVAIAGTGAADIIPDWDGLAGVPLPQLWDDAEHEVTTAAAKGGSSLNVSVTGGTSSGFTDALVPIANIVAIAKSTTAP